MKKVIEMTDIDFDKVRKPEFMKLKKIKDDFFLEEDMLARKFGMLIAESFDNSAVENIKKIAEAEGLTDVLMFNKQEIANALIKQIPKKPRLNDSDYAYFECDSCGTAIAYTFEPEEHKYCLHCGQALDWGQEDDR